MATTVIRHSNRSTQGEQHIAMVITSKEVITFQMYTVFKGGHCTLDIEEIYSTEQKAIARFEEVVS